MIGMSRKVLCLDWDKRSLRIVAARPGKGRTVLEDAHSHRLPNNVDADDPQAMGEFIRAMLRRHRLRHRQVIVDVPRERAVINRLKLPPTPLNEVAAAVRFQAMKELPFPLDSAAIDYVVMGRDAKGLANEVLLAAVTREALERVRLTCEAAGLTPTRIGLRPYANLISVQQMKGAATQRVLFVDVGPGATEIDVMAGDALAFARSANVNVPLAMIDPAARDDSRVISIADAADIEGGDEAVEAAIADLLVETTRTLQAYRATDPDAMIDEIIVAGGTGVEAQLADQLHERLGYPAATFDPTGPLGIPGDEAVKLRSFSAALGLAWGSGRDEALALDFLNPKRPVSSREVWQKRARIGVLAACIVLIGVGGLVMKQYRELAEQRRQLQEANTKRVAELRERLEVLNRVEEANEWAAEVVWPDELLNIVEQVNTLGEHPGEKLVVQELSLDTVSRDPGITLRNVYASDWQVPTELVTRLNELKGKDEQPLYGASQGTWTRVEGNKYHGKVDITVDLERLREFREQAGDRAKERKTRLRDAGRGR